MAKKRGATVIAITSFTDSILYKESDLAATVFADEVGTCSAYLLGGFTGNAIGNT